MINKFYVYALIDPDTNDTFYIGKGCGNRMFLHEKYVTKSKFTNNNILLTEKIRLILNNKKKIIYQKLFENLTNEEALLKEIEMVKMIGRKDLEMGSLLNMTDGGEGCLNVSKETRKKLSDSHKGMIFSEKHKNNLKRSAQNRTKDHIEKIASKNRGRKQSEETKRKISQAKKGMTVPWIKERHHDNETKQKLSKITTEYFSDPNNRKLSSERGINNPTFVKTWYFRNPKGDKIQITNLSKFCRENNFYYECMKQLFHGIKKSYKGWKKYEDFGS